MYMLAIAAWMRDLWSSSLRDVVAMRRSLGGTGTRWDGDKCADGSCVGCGRKVSELLRGDCHGEQAVCQLSP